MIPFYELSYDQIHVLLLLAEWCALHKIPPFDKGLEGQEFHNPMDISYWNDLAYFLSDLSKSVNPTRADLKGGAK